MNPENLMYTASYQIGDVNVITAPNQVYNYAYATYTVPGGQYTNSAYIDTRVIQGNQLNGAWTTVNIPTEWEVINPVVKQESEWDADDNIKE